MMLDYEERRKKGSHRKSIANFLKTAKEISQTYTGKLETNTCESSNSLKADHDLLSKEGEQLVLFPAYTKRHKRVDSLLESSDKILNLQTNLGSQAKHEVSGTTHNRDSEHSDFGHNDAIVDVDIQGWLYSPQTGNLSRKHKILVGLARQLGGIPTSGVPSLEQCQDSRSSTNGCIKSKVKYEGEQDPKKIEQLFQQTKEEQKKKLERYPESKRFDLDAWITSENIQNFRKVLFNYVQDDNSSSHSPGKDPLSVSEISQAELVAADSNLMSRIGPFLSTPLVSRIITIIFYNNVQSVVRTVRTNEQGNFMTREALNFIPDYARVFAMDNLSATEKITLIEPKGVSLISDIDDTIKHTSINSGAREVFRNSFIRDLKELRIDGVNEWYNLIYDMGVDFHYVSNSPWQLFPTLAKFFNDAAMPPGSFHLKNYISVFQGILEPVSERKKPTITKILSDFPERSFILVGDSGEADLEVYCDVVLANPGRILMVLIRNLNEEFSQSTMNLNIKNSHETEYSSPKNWLEPALELKNRPVKQFTISESSSKSHSGSDIDMLVDLSEAQDLVSNRDNSHGLLQNTCPLVKDLGASNNDSKSENQDKRLPPPRPYKPQALRTQDSACILDKSGGTSKKFPFNYHTKSESFDVSSYDTGRFLRQGKGLTHPIISVSSHDINEEPEIPVKCSSLNSKNTLEPREASRDCRLDTLDASGSTHSLRQFNEEKCSVRETVTNRFSWSGFGSSFYAEGNRSEAISVNKKLEIWRNRWKRAEKILGSQGIILREWRVGSDVCLETAQIIEKKQNELNIQAQKRDKR